MEFPVLSDLRKLDRSPRRFLFFAGTSVINYQCVVGSILVLFARHIGMPASLVGWLLSFNALAQLLVFVTVPIVDRFGPKRVLVAGWFIRSFFALPVLTIPLVLRSHHPEWAWGVLLMTMLCFRCVQGLAVGGWFPLLHQIIPERQRGAYFSAETGIVQFANIGASVLLAVLLGHQASLGNYMVIYMIGIAAGFASVYMLSRVSAGRESEIEVPQTRGWNAYRRALSDASFVRYALFASLCLFVATWINAALLLYLRDQLHLPSRSIMLLVAGASLAVAFTIRSWGRFSEDHGAPQGMFLTLGGFGCVCLGWLLLWPNAPWTDRMVAVAMIFGASFFAAFWAFAQRFMLSLVKTEGRVGYTNIWIVCTSVAIGIPPILVGQVIENWGLWGFRLCFLISGIGSLACAAGCLTLPAEAKPHLRYLTVLLRPSTPARTLGRIAWITLGRHIPPPSTQDEKPAPEEELGERAIESSEKS